MVLSLRNSKYIKNAYFYKVISMIWKNPIFSMTIKTIFLVSLQTLYKYF